MKILDIYHRLPYPLKVVFATIFGYLQKKRRYGGRFNVFVKELKKTEWNSDSEFDSLVKTKLRNILIHSFNKVPYYKNLFKKLSIDPFSQDPYKILFDLPVLEKETIRLNTKDFVSSNLKKYTLTSTSGSTGTPLKLYLSHEAQQYNYALAAARLLNWSRLKFSDRKVMFGGQLIVPVTQNSKPYWVYNYAENQLYCSAYHLSQRTLSDYYKKIEDFKPKYITGYTSAIYLFSNYILNEEKSINTVKAILPSSETLNAHQRKVMEKAFNCKVYDCYSLSEYVNYICECENGHLHISPEAGIVEILDDNNNIVEDGKVGRIISTSLFNYSMPLIKYDTGDLGIIKKEKCNCGRNMPILDKIIGRQDDFIITDDGRKIGRLDPVFKDVNNIIESQIVQRSINKIKVFVVPSDDFSKEDAQKVYDNLRMRVGDEIKITIKKVREIKRNKNGKFKTVICEIK